ncbi:MAG: hypothetical protein C0514_09240 [Candidatus Puniceispirillum sp.]|nr:hypothetical protein [Candidatus Puniceispirillum sp.]
MCARIHKTSPRLLLASALSGFGSHRDKETFSGHGRAQAEMRYCVGDLTPKKQRVNPDTCRAHMPPQSFLPLEALPSQRIHLIPGHFFHAFLLLPDLSQTFDAFLPKGGAQRAQHAKPSLFNANHPPHRMRMKMKHALNVLVICLLSTTSLLASMGEEGAPQEAASCAPITGKKRSYTHAYKGKEDDQETTKKQKANPGEKTLAQETTSQTVVFSSPLELLPNEVLVYISGFLPKEDFFTFTEINKHIREVLFSAYFQGATPPRTWRLALDFDEGTRRGASGLVFEHVVMPRVMEDLLVVFKSQNTNRVFDFIDTLEHFEDFTHQGQTLGQSTLWRFMSGIRKTNPHFLDVSELNAQANLGDGDALFLNMLAYIKSDFTADPKTLAHYRAPARERLHSPQERLYHADQLRHDLSALTTDTARALKWDEILKAFDYIDHSEINLAANTYLSAAKAAVEPGQKSAFFAKNAQLIENAHTDQCTATRTIMYHLAKIYHDAAHHAPGMNDKGRYYLKSTQWWEKYFKDVAAPAPEALRQAALTYHASANALRGTHHHTPLMVKARGHWDAYLEVVPHPAVEVTRDAASTYLDASFLTSSDTQRAYILRKSLALWESYLARHENPSTDDMRKATNTYLQTALVTVAKSERLALLEKGLALTQRYLPHVSTPTWGDVTLQALIHYETASAHSNAPQQKEHFLKSASFWFALGGHTQRMTPDNLKLAALAYRQAALHSEDPSQNLVYLMKAHEMFGRHLAAQPYPQKMIVSYAHEVSGLLSAIGQNLALNAPQDAFPQGL